MQPSSSVILTPPTLARPPETERRSSSPISPDFEGFLFLSGLEFWDGLDFSIGMKTSSRSLGMTQDIHGGMGAGPGSPCKRSSYHYMPGRVPGKPARSGLLHRRQQKVGGGALLIEL